MLRKSMIGWCSQLLQRCLEVVPQLLLLLLELAGKVLHGSPVEAKGVTLHTVPLLKLPLLHVVHPVVHVVLHPAVEMVVHHLVPVHAAVEAVVHLVPVHAAVKTVVHHLVPVHAAVQVHLVHAAVHLIHLVHAVIHLIHLVHERVHVVPLVHAVVHLVHAVGLLGVDNHLAVVVGRVLGSDIVLEAAVSLTLEHPALLVVHHPPGLILTLEHALVAVHVVAALLLPPGHVVPHVVVLALLHHAIKHVALTAHLVDLVHAVLFHGVLHAVSVNLVPPVHVHLVHAAPWGVHVLVHLAHMPVHVVLVHAGVHLVPLVHTAVHLNNLVPVVVHLVPLVHAGVHLLVVLVRPAVAQLVNVDLELVSGLLFGVSDLGLVGELGLSLGLPLAQGGVDGHGWVVEVVPAQSSSLGHVGQGG